MCDFSLHVLPNRLAVEGEPLLVYRFPTSTLGLASPADLQALAEGAPEPIPSRWWSAVRSWFIPSVKKSPPAVCAPPGTRLMLRDIPLHLQREIGVGAEEEVTFVQLSADAYSYRDAVRFNNGRELLLQKLMEGQRADVLCLALTDEAPQQTRAVMASH